MISGPVHWEVLRSGEVHNSFVENAGCEAGEPESQKKKKNHHVIKKEISLPIAG